MYVKRNSVTDEYELREEIGRGSYSVCRLCVHRSSRQEYAVKVCLFIFILKINGAMNESMKNPPM